MPQCNRQKELRDGSVETCMLEQGHSQPHRFASDDKRATLADRLWQARTQHRSTRSRAKWGQVPISDELLREIYDALSEGTNP